MGFIETKNYSYPEPNSLFQSENKVVGWIQGKHGATRPVMAQVIGRELSGVVTREEDNAILIRIAEFVKPSGNDHLLESLLRTERHEGLSGKEFIITKDLAPEEAFSLPYSSISNPREMGEGESLTINSDTQEQNHSFAFAALKAA